MTLIGPKSGCYLISALAIREQSEKEHTHTWFDLNFQGIEIWRERVEGKKKQRMLKLDINVKP